MLPEVRRPKNGIMQSKGSNNVGRGCLKLILPYKYDRISLLGATLCHTQVTLGLEHVYSHNQMNA